MTRAMIQEMQARLGVSPDGFWGPKSIAACQAHLRSLMPEPHPWPFPDETSLTSFYGPAGDTSRHTLLDVTGLGLRYDGKAVRQFTVHQRCASSLRRVIEAIAAGPHAAILKTYAGVYNNRPMRGGTRPSLHARAAAIDLDPANNGNRSHWPLQSTMPIDVMEAFAREGWLPAGAFWSRDAMHFQATR